MLYNLSQIERQCRSGKREAVVPLIIPVSHPGKCEVPVQQHDLVAIGGESVAGLGTALTAFFSFLCSDSKLFPRMAYRKPVMVRRVIQAGWGLEQPGLVEGVPAHGRGVGTR